MRCKVLLWLLLYAIVVHISLVSLEFCFFFWGGVYIHLYVCMSVYTMAAQRAHTNGRDATQCRNCLFIVIQLAFIAHIKHIIVVIAVYFIYTHLLL